MTDEILLEIGPISKSFGTNAILRDVHLTVRRGEFMTLLGPSGCGKTTTLRIIAGFESPDSGRVRLDGVDVTDQPPYERDVHTVFQHYALFPHLDVAGNIAFGMKHGPGAPGRDPPAHPRGPGHGQARGLRVAPRVVLVRRSDAARGAGAGDRGAPRDPPLDEPLGALDLKLRKEMQLELKRLQKKLGIAFVYVTHDQEEAMTMSDRIAVFNQGRIEQIGTPGRDLRGRPRPVRRRLHRRRQHLHARRSFPARPGRAHLMLEDEYEHRRAARSRRGPCPRSAQRVKVGIRPERVKVFYKDELPFGALRFDADLMDSVFLGDGCQIYLHMFKKNPGQA